MSDACGEILILPWDSSMCCLPELLMPVFDSAPKARLNKHTIFSRLILSRRTRGSLDDEIVAVCSGVIAALAQVI